MVDFGVTEIFIGHVPDFGQRLFYVDCALPKLFQESAELSFIHAVSAYQTRRCDTDFK